MPVKTYEDYFKDKLKIIDKLHKAECRKEELLDQYNKICISQTKLFNTLADIDNKIYMYSHYGAPKKVKK